MHLHLLTTNTHTHTHALTSNYPRIVICALLRAVPSLLLLLLPFAPLFGLHQTKHECLCCRVKSSFCYCCSHLSNDLVFFSLIFRLAHSCVAVIVAVIAIATAVFVVLVVVAVTARSFTPFWVLLVLSWAELDFWPHNFWRKCKWKPNEAYYYNHTNTHARTCNCSWQSFTCTLVEELGSGQSSECYGLVCLQIFS